MPRLRPFFIVSLLIAASLVTSGYRFRCYMFCNDQSTIQAEYVEQRDHCRQFAQLKAETSSPLGMDDKKAKSQLITLFSDCMARRGWAVPDGKDKALAAATGTGNAPAAAGPAAQGVGASAAGAPQQNAAPANPAEDQAYIARASECNFARQNASVSSNAAARAKACDLECEHHLKAAPDAPRSPACRAEMKSNLSRGHDE
jgi:hypothetical protein